MNERETPRGVTVNRVRRNAMGLVRKLIYAICVLGIWLSLTGCNTAEGVGEDVQAGGRAIERAAE
jgi:entericidin B